MVDFWSIEIAGGNPSIFSTFGFSICPRNCLAYEDSDSMYRLCPSAKIVSNASDDLPDPDNPVSTVKLSLGISTSIFFRLCSLAPLIIIFLNLFLDIFLYLLSTAIFLFFYIQISKHVFDLNQSVSIFCRDFKV